MLGKYGNRKKKTKSKDPHERCDEEKVSSNKNRQPEGKENCVVRYRQQKAVKEKKGNQPNVHIWLKET